MGGAEGGSGLATGLVSGEELLDFNGSAAVNTVFGHHPNKSDLQGRVNHGVGRSLTIGAVMLLQSGPPITVATQQNKMFSNSAGALRADVIKDAKLPEGEREIYRWLSFGNQGVGLVRGPGVSNLNTSLIRTFRIPERYQLQFRGEAFNLASHANFGMPGRVFEGPGFGIVSSARPARQIQVGMRLTF